VNQLKEHLINTKMATSLVKTKRKKSSENENSKFCEPKAYLSNGTLLIFHSVWSFTIKFLRFKNHDLLA